MKYQVRIKKFESRRWQVVSEHDTRKEAQKAAIKLDFANRRDFDRQYDSIEVKHPDGTRYAIA